MSGLPARIKKTRFWSCPFCVSSHGAPKRTWETKKIAKEQARKIHQKAINVYRCPHQPHGWHIGHLPEAVCAGKITRDVLRGGK